MGDRFGTISFHTFTNKGHCLGDVEGEERRCLRASAVAPGEVARVEILGGGRHQLYGRVEELRTPHPGRVVPQCPITETCGGCPRMFLDASSQLQFKGDALNTALKAHLGSDAPPMVAVTPSPQIWHYRHRASFVMGLDGQLGTYARGSHTLIQTSDCPVTAPVLLKAKAVIQRIIKDAGITPYDETTGEGILRFVQIQNNGLKDAAAQVYILLVATTTEGVDWPKLAKNIRLAIPEAVGVALNLNEKKGNAILGPITRHLDGANHLEVSLGGQKMFLPPGAFAQVNLKAAEGLYQQVFDWAGQGRRALDLYCGVGFMALGLSKSFDEVLGIEWSSASIEGAKLASVGVPNLSFMEGDVLEILEALPESPGEVIVVNPPRRGLAKGVVSACLKRKPMGLIYVSCNPKTLARDLALFIEGGLRIQGIQAFDLFPHTEHLETVVHLVNGRIVGGQLSKPTSTTPNGPGGLAPKFCWKPPIAVTPLALEVAQNIADAGGVALMVGGWVRDGLLGGAPKDEDLEVYGLSPEAARKAIRRRCQKVGADFGIFKVGPLDVSFPQMGRNDGFGQDPSITVSDAVLRRDLTINAFFWDPLSQGLYDPCGGLEDLKNGLLRCVDVQTFVEDPIRALRVIQFMARLGFQPHPDILALLPGLVPKLFDVPFERVWQELKSLLLKGRFFVDALQVAQDAGILHMLSPSLALLGPEKRGALARSLERRTSKSVFEGADELTVALALLLFAMAEPERLPFLERWVRERRLIKSLPPLVANLSGVLGLVLAASGGEDIKPDLRRLARTVFLPTLLEAARCHLPPEIDLRLVRLIAEEAGVWNGPLPALINGGDLIKMAVEPGPRMGRILEAVYQSQLLGNTLTRADALKLAQNLSDGGDA